MSSTAQQIQQYLNATKAGSQIVSNLAPSSGLAGASPYLGNAASGAGIIAGLQQGGVSGYGSAAAGGAKLAGNLAGNSNLSSLGQGAGSALGIINGIKTGGVGGYGQAAVSGAQLGAQAGLLPAVAGTAAGYAAVPLAIYNEAKNWQSGATGADALGGAASGAAIGTMVLPGIGTAVGALLGAAGGALSSAFGNGRVDPENATFEGYTQAYNKAAAQNPALGNQVAAATTNPYLALAGMFDLRKNQIKGNIPIYNEYGRMGEQKFTNDFDSHIDSALKAGTIKPGDDANTIYNKAVAPWINSMGDWEDSNKNAMTALLKQMGQQYVTGQYQQDWKSIGGQTPFAQQAAPASNLAATTPAAQTKGSQRMARGGAVNDYERQARLHEIYKHGLRKTNYDDGGGVTTYFGDTPTDSGDVSSWYNLPDYLGDQTSTVGGYDAGSLTADPFDLSGGSSGSSGGSGATTGSALASLLKNLGVSGATAQSAAPYAALAPLLGSLLGANKQGSAPSLPSQYQGQVMNLATPADARKQNNLSGMTMDDWLHAGEGPEIQYYQNNALPATPMSDPNQQVAQAVSAATGQPFAGGTQAAPIAGGNGRPVGGSAANYQAPTPQSAAPSVGLQPVTRAPMAVMAAGGPYDDPSAAYGTSAVGHVKGPGDGTSDSIKLKNAYLSNGEYVMDAPTVSILGAGSNDAGAKALDALRVAARKHAGKHLAKGKQPMKAFDPVAHMFGGGQ